MKDNYQLEAKRMWGDTDEFIIAAKRTKSYTTDDWIRIKNEAREIYNGFQQSISKPLGSESVKFWVEAWQSHLDRAYFPCNDEMLLRLASLYEQDWRYERNIDAKGGEGTAQRMIQSIRYWKSRAG